MQIEDAAYKTVHNVKRGGSVALAARLGMSSNVLNSKVNPNCDTHHLRLDEAVAIMEFTDDHSIAHAMAQRLGGVYCPVESGTTQDDLLMTALSTSACQGDIMSEMYKALEDGRIDKHERDALQPRIQKAMAMLQALSNHVEQQYANDNPHLQGR